MAEWKGAYGMDEFESFRISCPSRGHEELLRIDSLTDELQRRCPTRDCRKKFTKGISASTSCAAYSVT